MEVQQNEKKGKKIPMPRTFNMLYEVLRSGNKISTPKNEEGYKVAEETDILTADLQTQACGREKLKGANMTITKSSPGSCVSCLARFAVELGRIGGSSDPCSLRFRGSQPCYRIGSSNLVR